MKKSNLIACYNGEGVSFKKVHSADKENPLFEAVRKNDVGLIVKLISQGCKVDEQRLCDGFTPLMCAVSHNNLQSVSALLNAGATLNIKSSTDATAISIALKSADFNHKIIKELLDHGATTSLKEIEYYNQDYLQKSHYYLDIISYTRYKNNIPEDDLCEKEKSKLYVFHNSNKSYGNIPELLIISSSDSSSDDELLSFPSDSSSSYSKEYGTTKPYRALLNILDHYSYISLLTNFSCLNCYLTQEEQKDVLEIMPMFKLEHSDSCVGYLIHKKKYNGEEFLEAQRLLLSDKLDQPVSLKVKDLVSHKHHSNEQPSPDESLLNEYLLNEYLSTLGASPDTVSEYHFF